LVTEWGRSARHHGKSCRGSRIICKADWLSGDERRINDYKAGHGTGYAAKHIGDDNAVTAGIRILHIIQRQYGVGGIRDGTVGIEIPLVAQRQRATG
jgi:hypothetical protein